MKTLLKLLGLAEEVTTIRLAELTKSNVPHENIITIYYSDGSRQSFEGDCTVWLKLPLMEPVTTCERSDLYRIQKYIKKYGNPYPTAHTYKDLQ